MAQALMAVVLQRPDTARARPSSLLKKDDDYKTVFDPAFPIELFRAVIELTHAAEKALAADASLSKEDRVNLKFYLAMYLSALACKSVKPKPKQLKAFAGKQVDAKLVASAVVEVKAQYSALGGDSNVAKGAELREVLLAQLEKKLSKPKSSSK